MIQLPQQTPLSFPTKADKWPRASDSCGFKSRRLSRSSRLLGGPLAGLLTTPIPFYNNQARQPTHSTRLFHGQSQGAEVEESHQLQHSSHQNSEGARQIIGLSYNISNFIMYPSQQIPSSPPNNQKKTKTKKTPLSFATRYKLSWY